MKKGKKYLITWADTFSNARWMSSEQIQEEAILRGAYIETIGYFVGKFGDFTCIATHWDNSDETKISNKSWGDINWIPSRTIKKYKMLK